MPRRHSLLVRLLAICIAVAACSITATAWIASISTAASIHDRYTANLASDNEILDALVGYAATHTSWDGVGPMIAALAKKSTREITLATPERQLIASSAAHASVPTASTPSAVVNALAVASTSSSSGGIDARAVGPFKLTAVEQRASQSAAKKQAACVADSSVKYTSPPLTIDVQGAPGGPVAVLPTSSPTAATTPAKIITMPNGRAEVTPNDKALYLFCAVAPAIWAFPTEVHASAELVTLINKCLRGAAVPAKQRLTTSATGNAQYVSTRDPHWLTDQVPVIAQDVPSLTGCVDTARREQLTPYVAAPAQLFISNAAPSVAKAGLTSDGKRRIALAALAILLLTVTVCAFAATRLVRPLRALTVAAVRVGRGERAIRVAAGRRGEIAELGSAFNRMSTELADAETRRKELVSDVAHELRTPLGNIRGWLEAIQDGVAEPDPELIESLLEESQLLQHVIDDLQDLALADAGKLTFYPEPLDAAVFVQQVAAAHRAAAQDKGVSIDVDCPPTLPLTTDANRLRQILGNLVSNAVRYTPSGGRVTVRARSDHDAVVIAIEDTGIGISEADLPHVFSRFWRAERSRGRRGGGSGLGLAIARQLVEAQGGELTARSELGAGSVFSFRLSNQGLSGG
jgi:two-component system sensor histidine kinase BaeS